jgi:cytochrome c oxidase cbb3-type subunit 3
MGPVIALCRRVPRAGTARSLRVRSLVGLAMLAAGCSTQLPGKPNPKDRPVPADDVLVFDSLFARNCAGCHGADGKWGPAPPLNDPLFRAIVPQAELAMVLEKGRRQGVNNTSMAPFAHDNGGPLSAAQVQVLVHEIKGVPYRIERSVVDGEPKVKIAPDEHGIAPKWGAVGPALASVPSYTLPKTSGSADQGAKIFSRACASCHGNNGAGVEKDGKLRNKINDVFFLALISDQELRRIMITGRQDLKMPNYAEKTGRPEDFQPLTSADIADLGALLSAWRAGSPAK